jgi:hypothetical protein
MTIRTRRLVRALVAGWVSWLLVPGFLAGCGDDGAVPGPQYALTIDEPLSSTTDLAEATLSGDGFVPPGSVCPDPGCSIGGVAPVFGQLGAYALGWRNEADGATGTLQLRWICNCGGDAPFWIGRIPLVPGPNRITVTMTAGAYEQSASVTVTRR